MEPLLLRTDSKEEKEESETSSTNEDKPLVVHSAEQRRIIQSGLLRGAMACVMRPRSKTKAMW